MLLKARNATACNFTIHEKKAKSFLFIHFPNGVLNFGSMCNQGKPCRKRLYFFLSPYIFFTCRNHCNICTGYEFFCHKKDINTLGGWKITEKVGKLRLSSQAGATFTDTCFQHMVKKNIHRSFLISSIIKEMTNFELSHVLKLCQIKIHPWDARFWIFFLIESTACCKKKSVQKTSIPN